MDCLFESLSQALDRQACCFTRSIEPPVAASSLVEKFEFERIEDGIKILASVTNAGVVSFELGDIDYLKGTHLPTCAQLDRVFSHNYTMTGPVSVAPLEEGIITSHCCLGLSNSRGTAACLIGFTELDGAFCDVKMIVENGQGIRLHAYVHRECTLLEPGQTLRLSPLVIWQGDSLSNLLDRYAQLTGENLGVRMRGHQKKRGWCSWYHYYGTENEQDIMVNARELASSIEDHRGMVIQIDDGWNLKNQGQNRVWGDWTPGYKFPGGLRRLTDEIHQLGFDAGLWLAPFSVDPSSCLAKEHEDWLLKKHDGSGFAELGECYGLDLTVPAVLDFLEKTFENVFHLWNFDYVKLDFLNHGLMQGVRMDRSRTSVEAFRNAMRLIRKCGGDWKYILNCGGPLGPSIGICDGMRVGNDVGGRWYNAMNLEEWPHGNCSIRSAAYPSLYRQWMHGRWWDNDPDCLITRPNAVAPELEAWKRMFPEALVSRSDFGLSYEESCFWVRLVWMTGGIAMLSEMWGELQRARRLLAIRAFEKSPQLVRWVDYYERTDLVILQSYAGYPAVGIFNLSDEHRIVSIPREKLRLTNGCACDWLTGEPIDVSGIEISFPSLAPHSARVWIQTNSDRQQ